MASGVLSALPSLALVLPVGQPSGKAPVQPNSDTPPAQMSTSAPTHSPEDCPSQLSEQDCSYDKGTVQPRLTQTEKSGSVDVAT